MLIALFRTLILYIVIIIAMRLMGKRQIAQLEPSELVVTVIISELAAIPLQSTETPLLNGIIPIFALISLEIISSVIALKSDALRSVLTGSPVVIMENGVLDQKALEKVRFTIDDLMEQLRLLSIFELKECSYIIVETNGSLSVLKKSDNRSVTRGDISHTENEDTFPAVVVSDGKLCEQWLKVSRVGRNAVDKILKRNGIDREDCFLLQLSENGKYNIIKKEGKK